ncbi:MAG: hypothetical protein ACK5W0_17565 [Labrys sp. (in: a-proteobacteria)]
MTRATIKNIDTELPLTLTIADFPDPRDELIDAVRHGRKFPYEADTEALRLGLEPLSFEPNPAAFDPMRETFWTPAMAIAWIASRTTHAVREMWNAYRAECRDWHFRDWRVGLDGPIHSGYFLETRRPATLMTLRLIEAMSRQRDESPGKMTVADAIGALMTALQEGQITASGLPLGSGSRATVAPAEWHDLEHFEEDEEDQFHGRPGVEYRGGYSTVLLPRATIIGLWRADPERAAPTEPEIIRPEGHGYMTMFHAALWIGTEGGLVRFPVNDEVAWETAFRALLAAVSTNAVSVIGVRDGTSEPIPGYHFAGCPVDLPWSDTSIDLRFGMELYLRSYSYIDEDHWRKGFDDSLCVGRIVRWSRLMVPKEHVVKLWPFAIQAAAGSGLPGRPTSKHLIDAEFMRRAEAGEMASKITDEANALVEWLRIHHPDAQVPTTKTVRNNLAARFRAATNARK